MSKKPILIPDSAVPKQIMTAVQYVVTAVCSYLLGRGYLQQDTVTLIMLLLPIVVVPAYGIYKTYLANEKLKTIVNSPNTDVPNSVAEVVS
jgi:hypothetical protein